ASVVQNIQGPAGLFTSQPLPPGNYWVTNDVSDISGNHTSLPALLRVHPLVGSPSARFIQSSVTSGGRASVELELLTTNSFKEVLLSLEMDPAIITKIAFEPDPAATEFASIQPIETNSISLDVRSPLQRPFVGRIRIGSLRFDTRPMAATATLPMRWISIIGIDEGGRRATNNLVATEPLVAVGSTPLGILERNSFDQLSLTVFGATGRVYRVETTLDPAQGPWIYLQDLTLAATSFQAPLALGPTAARGLRVIDLGPLSSANLVVTTVLDEGPGSLRMAIASANLLPGANTIRFNISGPGPHVIAPLSPLPSLMDSAIIDGYSQPGALLNTLSKDDNAVLRIVLSGSQITAGSGGLEIRASDCVVRGLVINAFATQAAVRVTQGQNTVIEGNFFGTTADGSSAIPNLYGVLMTSGRELSVGGVNPGSRNLISGNSICGIAIVSPNGGYLPDAAGHRIQNNFIGVDRHGALKIPNGCSGIAVNAGPAKILGNVISGNRCGVLLGGDRHIVAGNMIGTDVLGLRPLGNDLEGLVLGLLTDSCGGFSIGSCRNTMVGGPNAEDRNIISANTNLGVWIGGPGSSNNIVQGNYIGLNASGSSRLGNGIGVMVSNAPNITIGGAIFASRNIISGNGYGVLVRGGEASTGARIQGNYIGLDPAGLISLGNTQDGVQFVNSPGNSIGGGEPGAGNSISGNGRHGIAILGSPGSSPSDRSAGNTVQGNRIGTTIDGHSRLGNGGNGVLLVNADENLIGGLTAGAGNVIANNTTGVRLSRNEGGYALTRTNAILGNSIYANGVLGISLNPFNESDPLLNDVLDADAGPNLLQNYPIISSVHLVGGLATLSGGLTSAPSTTYRVEFFANSTLGRFGYGQGEKFIGFIDATTDGSGSRQFSATFQASEGFTFFTATATDRSGNTSEFSPSVALSPANGPPGSPSDGSNSLRLNVSFVRGSVSLTWNGETEVLESADSVMGPWEIVADAEKAREFRPESPQRFYRLRAAARP
ncbi:MAG: hypothetical protein HYR88_14265, partial [Verrucomicrobia bacterium]|nr:hypothetical protein [Verrucomicrobiota bacterium]